ncbi:hypothetical protein P8C59_005157 [Phyllachora maydis]|uniref:Uncharacterized protein n=1 Tax=Phyllachora maydis TaxID=1825666 RepID=A0AAD9MD77_9PEZI|nr:hypothetical protein P8C59_005157 [Phyllachora maydis]
MLVRSVSYKRIKGVIALILSIYTGIAAYAPIRAPTLLIIKIQYYKQQDHTANTTVITATTTTIVITTTTTTKVYLEGAKVAPSTPGISDQNSTF